MDGWMEDLGVGSVAVCLVFFGGVQAFASGIPVGTQIIITTTNTYETQYLWNSINQSHCLHFISAFFNACEK